MYILIYAGTFSVPLLVEIFGIKFEKKTLFGLVYTKVVYLNESNTDND